MKPILTLIYNHECVACSAIAQLIGAKAPDIAKVSYYSPKAQMLLRRHYPGGWAFRPYMIANDGQHEKVLSGASLFWKVSRLLGPVGMIRAAHALMRNSRRQKARGSWAAPPDDQMRGYIPASIVAAETYAGETLMLPDPIPAGLRRERMIQWYNQHGAFQTASYWKHGESGSLVLEQVHRACALPVVEGAAPELVDLGNGRNAHCYISPKAGSEAITLIAGCENGRWLSLRATGINRDVVLAIARNCYQEKQGNAFDLMPESCTH